VNNTYFHSQLRASRAFNGLKIFLRPGFIQHDDASDDQSQIFVKIENNREMHQTAERRKSKKDE